jgi:hypothetical protein
MTANISKQEAQIDLEDTQRDVKRAKIIAGNIRLFITETGQTGEDRNYLRVDLLRWEGIVSQGLRLESKIQDYLSGL